MSSRNHDIFRILKAGIVIPAIPLALHEDLLFDSRRQRALIRYYLEAGARGVAVAVHSTQFEIREHPETHTALMQLAVDEINAFEKKNATQIVKITGVAGRTKEAVAEATRAKALGYDLVLASPGAFANDETTAELLDYYRQLTAVMPVFGFYLQPAVGGRVLPYEFWQELFTIKNVIGVKTAPFDRYHTIDVIRAIRNSGRQKEIALYTGNDDHIIFDLLSRFDDGDGDTFGFDGGLLGQWSVWTKKAVELLERTKEALRTGIVPESLLIEAADLTDANGAVFDILNNFNGVIAGIHEVLRRQGFFEDIVCYEKNGVLSPGQSAELDRVMAAYPYLTDDDFVKANIERWLDESSQ